MKKNQLKMGTLLTYFQMILGVLVGLLYTPVMIRSLGQSEYGLYNTVASTISMLSILNLGFNSSYVRYYAEYKKKEDNEAIYRLNGMFICIFTVIGLIALVCGMYLTKNLELVFSSGLTSAEYILARKLMLVLTVNLAISFPMSVFQSIVSANERFVFLKLLGMLKTVGGPLVTLPLLLMGYRSVAMVCMTLLITCITDVLYFVYVVVVLKNRFVFRGFDRGLLADLFVYTSFIAINIIIDQINLNVDKVLLGRYKGTEATAVYAVGYSLYHYYSMSSTAVSSVFTPRVHHIVKQNDNLTKRSAALTDLFIRVGRIQFLILGLIVTGIIFFGKQFIVLWAGAEYTDAYYVLLLLSIPATVPLIQNTGIEIQRALNRHQFRSVVYLIMAIHNLVISIFLCQRYGVVGSATGTAISFVLANGLIMNVYYHKKCEINIKLFWKEIGNMVKGLLIPFMSGWVICFVLDTKKPIGLMFAIVLYSLIYAVSMWCLGMNVSEKDLVRKPVQKVLRKLMR